MPFQVIAIILSSFDNKSPVVHSSFHYAFSLQFTNNNARKEGFSCELVQWLFNIAMVEQHLKAANKTLLQHWRRRGIRVKSSISNVGSVPLAQNGNYVVVLQVSIVTNVTTVVPFRDGSRYGHLTRFLPFTNRGHY